MFKTKVKFHFFFNKKSVFYIFCFKNYFLKESFKAIDYWYQTVENHKINPVIALIGTKADLKEERQVSVEEAEEKARQLKCDHCLTSSKEDTNVENAFLNHVKAIRKNPNYLMNKVPSASAVMAQMNVNLNSYPDNSSWFCC